MDKLGKRPWRGGEGCNGNVGREPMERLGERLCKWLGERQWRSWERDHRGVKMAMYRLCERPWRSWVRGHVEVGRESM